MQRYAIIKDGNVVNVIEYESQPSNPPPGFDDTYIAVQSDVASVGWTYNNGVFIKPQPYPSWTLKNNKWEAPITMPEDGKYYLWDEINLDWKEIVIP